MLKNRAYEKGKTYHRVQVLEKILEHNYKFLEVKYGGFNEWNSIGKYI